MITALEDGILTSDLDADHFQIINIGSITPPPPNLVVTTDPRLSDAREPLPGSVTNDSVAANAFIAQSKLNLNGDLPTAWIGTTSATAARGDLAEYLVNKGQPGGYAGLDAAGLVLPAQLPPDIGLGTVTSVTVNVPAELAVSGNPVVTSGTIDISWNNVPDGSWFGNNTGAPGVPAFLTDPIPASLVPDLPASKITSGTIDPARLPVAVGVGVGHSPGAVPDPGVSGDPTDYLARDMTFKSLPSIGPSYQPTLNTPTLLVISVGPPSEVNISYSSSGNNVSLFYKLSVTAPTTYIPAPVKVFVPTGETLSVYGAKAGYTNSAIATYTAP